MSELENKKTPIIELDTLKAFEALQDNPELRAYFMSQLLESSYELEKNLKNLPESVDERVKEQINISINELTEKVTLIRDAIKELPSDLDQQVASMLNVVQTSHDTTMADINLLQERVNIANGMALSTISEAMLNASHAFEKSLIESKNKVFDEGVAVVKDTNRQMAWVIIGATLVINIVSIGFMFFSKWKTYTI